MLKAILSAHRLLVILILILNSIIPKNHYEYSKALLTLNSQAIRYNSL